MVIAGQLLLSLHSIKDRKLVKSHNTEPLPQNIVSPFFRDTLTQKKTCLLVAAEAIDFSICLSEYGGTEEACNSKARIMCKNWLTRLRNSRNFSMLEEEDLYDTCLIYKSYPKIPSFL